VIIYRQHRLTQRIHIYAGRGADLPECGNAMPLDALETLDAPPGPATRARLLCGRCSCALAAAERLAKPHPGPWQHGSEHARRHRSRWRRIDAPRPKTISAAKRLTADELAVAEQLKGVSFARPLFRGDCVAGPRPCPWVGCRYHMYVDVTRKGGLQLNFPTMESWEIEQTCALDIAEMGGLTLEESGETMNITRERIRQLEVRALAKLKADFCVGRLAQYVR
jgi:hypothetical protein